MTLQEKWDKFKRQQESCQAIVTSIAACNKARPPIQKVTPAMPSAIFKPPAPAVKFSDDVGRLQLILKIRKSPEGAQIRRVIVLLRETRQGLTAEQIYEACYVDINANKIVFNSLVRNNDKVNYDGKRFSYKSKHDLKNKSQLLELIRKFPDGIAVVDLKDAYPTVMEDLQAFKAEGQIRLLSSWHFREGIAYPNDPEVPIKVDDDLKELFRGIELPHDMLDIENYLQNNGTMVRSLPPTLLREGRWRRSQAFPPSPRPRRGRK